MKKILIALVYAFMWINFMGMLSFLLFYIYLKSDISSGAFHTSTGINIINYAVMSFVSLMPIVFSFIKKPWVRISLLVTVLLSLISSILSGYVVYKNAASLSMAQFSMHDYLLNKDYSGARVVLKYAIELLLIWLYLYKIKPVDKYFKNLS